MTPIERVAARADKKPVKSAVKVSSPSFDLQGFMAQHGLQVRKEKLLPNGITVYELEVCPFNSEHIGGSAYITRSAEGALGFGCHHNSCAEKDWIELRLQFDPNYQSWISKNGSAKAAEPEPGSEANATPIDPAQMVGDIERFIRRFVVLPEAAYLPLCIWVIATHAFEHFDCFPYVALLSPVKRCGKTRLLEVLEPLVNEPWRGTAPTPAALYRMMEETPTLLLDEVEALNNAKSAKSESSQAILAILNAGYRKGAAIPRCDGPKNELKHFDVFGPKAFAAIGRLPDTLTDRSIVIAMQRRTKSQKVERFLMSRATAEARRQQCGQIRQDSPGRDRAGIQPVPRS
jgi:hypothetical protein